MVATPAIEGASEAKQQRVQFDTEAVGMLEAWIDNMDTQLPQLTAFILPSGMCLSCCGVYRWHMQASCNGRPAVCALHQR